MSWWCWTWVLYSENTVATSLEQSIWERLPPGYACGIRLFGKRTPRQLTPSRLAGPAAKWIQQPEGYWRHTGWTSILCTAQGTAWDSKFMKILGWPRAKKHSLPRETWLR